MRVFLDANVLFSGSNVSNNLGRLIEMLLEKAAVATSDLASEEAARNILAKRPAWEKEFKRIMEKIIILPTRVRTLPVKLADKDISLLASAISGGCDYFVTGDKRDFGHLFETSVDGVKVVLPFHMGLVLLREEDFSAWKIPVWSPD